MPCCSKCRRCCLRLGTAQHEDATPARTACGGWTSSRPAAAVPAPPTLLFRSLAVSCLRSSPRPWGPPWSSASRSADRSIRPEYRRAVSGKVLTLEVSYAGGCRHHDRQLPGESSPVQLELVLTHDANEDPSEAYPTRQLRFDLAPIRDATGRTTARTRAPSCYASTRLRGGWPA